jgi:hypothetical protein
MILLSICPPVLMETLDNVLNGAIVNVHNLCDVSFLNSKHLEQVNGFYSVTVGNFPIPFVLRF